MKKLWFKVCEFLLKNDFEIMEFDLELFDLEVEEKVVFVDW